MRTSIKLLLAASVLIGCGFIAGRGTAPGATMISLPEEISQASPGDKLGVRQYHDTLYIEFNPVNHPLTVVK